MCGLKKMKSKRLLKAQVQDSFDAKIGRFTRKLTIHVVRLRCEFLMSLYEYTSLMKLLNIYGEN